MVTRKLGAALAAGNTVVLKAPAETPYSVLALAEIARRAGVPDGVINVVLTSKHTIDVGKELCENPTIHKISFTGSTRVGKILMKQASSTLKKLSFELGGNAPFIVFDDADLDKAVAGVVLSKFRYASPLFFSLSPLWLTPVLLAVNLDKLASAPTASSSRTASTRNSPRSFPPPFAPSSSARVTLTASPMVP
jgi:hypothetical protein